MGEECLPNVCVVTTFGPPSLILSDNDSEDTKIWKKRVQELHGQWSQGLWGAMVQQFHRTHESAVAIVESLPFISNPATAKRIPLQIQIELVTRRKKLNRTEAGKLVNGFTQEMMILQKQLQRNAMRRLGGPLKPEARARLDAEVKEITKTLNEGAFDLRLLLQVSWQNLTKGINSAAHFLYHFIVPERVCW